MIYFTADLHLGHKNIVHHCSRPFQTVDEMDRCLIERWNQRVGPEDTVYVLGDMMFSCKDPASYLRQLAGKKHLILGNHDVVWMKRLKKMAPDLLETAFESVQLAAELTVDGCKLVLSHYPMMTWNGFAEGAYLIFGHIHNQTSAPYWPLLASMEQALNAGVDVNDFRPVTLEELKANNDAFRRTHREEKSDVVVLRSQGKFGLLRASYQAPRTECLEFPHRVKEVAAVAKDVQYLGSVRADTGLSAGCTQVVLAEIEAASAQIGHGDLIWLTEAELREKIAAGEITDSFTLSALSLYRCREN